MKNSSLLPATLASALIAIYLDVCVGHGLWKQYGTSHYSETTGRIIRSQVLSYRGRHNHIHYYADLDFIYEVNGRKFDGERIRYKTYTSLPYGGQKSSSEMVREHPVGSEVPVYYNPNDPEDSVLLTGVNSADWFVSSMLAPWNLIVIGMAWAAAGPMIKRNIKRGPGGVNISVQGGCTRVRFPAVGAWGCGLMMLILVSFASPVLWMIFRLSPPVEAIYVLLFLELAASVYATVSRWLSIRAGIYDLMLDEQRKTLDAPIVFGRKERVKLDFSEVEDVTVEVTEKRDGKNRPFDMFDATLQARDGTSLKMGTQWSERAEAEAFVNWLRDFLKMVPSAAS